MSERELEERVLINKKQFLEIKKYIQENYPDTKVIHQKNRYLDDANSSIRKLKNVLRIRSFPHNNTRELTYKTRGNNCAIEYTQKLTYYAFIKFIENSIIPEGEIKTRLLSDGIDINSIKSIVDLRTRRLEVHLEQYTIVLDVNDYNGIIDYDLEIESNFSESHAKEVILDFCNRFGLEYKNDYPVKSRRAFESIK